MPSIKKINIAYWYQYFALIAHLSLEVTVAEHKEK